jgi:uncharacterized protein (TIRG00374 family)
MISDSTQGETGHLISAPPKGEWLKPALGYLFALVCLVWVFYDVDVRAVLGHAREISWRWVALAVLCDVLSYVSQGARWSLLLRPVGRVSNLRATQAVYAGLFTNEVLPLKAGEVVRAYLMARWTQSSLPKILPSVVAERVFDGIWLVAAITLAAFFVPLPHDLVEAGHLIGIVIIVAAGIFGYLIARRSGRYQSESAEPADAETNGAEDERMTSARRPKWKSWRRVAQTASSFITELNAIEASGVTCAAFFLSLLLLVLQALSFWLVMVAYGMRLSFLAGATVFVIIHLSTALPNAPGNVGSYQFFTVVGLTLFGIDKSYAAGFSIVVFILLTIPLLLIGFVALSRSGLTLLAVRDDLRRLRRHS